MFAAKPGILLVMGSLISLAGMAGQLYGDDEKKGGAADENTIRALITELSNDSFDKREAAQKSLAEVGRPALPLLRKAMAETKDAEVRERATKLVEDIQETGLEVIGAEFYHDFRRKGFQGGNFLPFGLDADVRVKSEPDGLRPNLTAEISKKYDAVGVISRFKIHGDFEITTAYEILHAPKPAGGRGVGYEFYLMTETTNFDALSFNHTLRPDGTQAYVAMRTLSNAQGRREQAFSNAPPAQGKGGQLRVVRIGTKAVFSVRPDGADTFSVTGRTDASPADVKYVRLGANQGAGPYAIDLRILDLRVRTQLKARSRTSLSRGASRKKQTDWNGGKVGRTGPRSSVYSFVADFIDGCFQKCHRKFNWMFPVSRVRFRLGHHQIAAPH